MRRALALACLACLAGGALAPDVRAEQQFRVVVVGLHVSDLERFAGRGAVGLLVPDAGPTTSEQRARAALVRGQVRNSLRGGLPSGKPLISLGAGVLAGTMEQTIIVSLPSGGEQPNNRHYPVAVLGPGWRGLLTSESTRIAGLVSIADIAPTALGRDDGLGSKAVDDPVATLRELDERIAENGDARLPAFLLWAALTAALALVSPRAAVLAFATMLLANLLLGAVGVSELWAVLAATVLAVAAAVPLAFLRSPRALGGVLAGTLAAYLLAFAIDQGWLALSPLGPTQNSRFYGLSNLLETMLLVPALAGAAVLGGVGFAAVAALALVTVAGSRFGADGGGAIVLAVGFAVLAVGLAGASRRALVAALAAAGALVLALVGLDALTGASSHVTRSLSGGPAGVASDLSDRAVLSFERATAHWYVAVVVVAALAALGLLLADTLRHESDRRRRALVVAFAAAIGASLIVNDSPVDITLAGVVGYLALASPSRPGRRVLRALRLPPSA